MHNKKRLHVHIGVHKNATTHLQHVLHSNRGLIESNHTALYLPSDLRPALGEHLFGIASDESAHSHLFGLRELFGLLAAPDTIDFRIVFDENICGRLKPLVDKVYPMLVPRLTALLSVFDNHSVSIFLCLRNYADFYRSAYLEYIRTSKHLTFEEFVGDFDCLGYGWPDLINDLLTVVKPHQLVLYRYDQYRQIMPKVAARLVDVPSAKMNLQQGERIYQSLSNKAIDIVENSMHILSREERVLALKALETVFPKTALEDPRSFWTDDDEQYLKRKFEADYQVLRDSLEGATFID